MSIDFTDDPSKSDVEEKGKGKDTPITLLSEYGKRLESHVKCRYFEKIEVIGIDPASFY
jgi:hypothetical protein